VAGRRIFRILTYSQQSGIKSKNSNTHIVQHYTHGRKILKWIWNIWDENMDWVHWHRKGPCDELVKETAVPSISEKRRCCMELFKTKGILFVVNGSVDFYDTKKLYMIRRVEVEKYDMWGWETADVRERQNLCEERPFENVAATRARRRAGTQSSAFTHFTEIRQPNPIPLPSQHTKLPPCIQQ